MPNDAFLQETIIQDTIALVPDFPDLGNKQQWKFVLFTQTFPNLALFGCLAFFPTESC